MSNNSNRRSGPISPTGKAGYSFLVVVVLMVGMVIFTAMFGQVSGTEFNPYSFDSREFTYYEIPILHLQVMPTTRVPLGSSLQQWIAVDQQAIRNPDAETRWDLVDGRRIGAKPVPGNAMVISEYMMASTGGDLVWLEWSKKRPELARKFWPRVAWLAQQDLYFLIPDLIDFAKGDHPSVDEFADGTDELMERLLTHSAAKFRDAEQVDRAAFLEDSATARPWHALEVETSQRQNLSPKNDLPAEAPNG